MIWSILLLSKKNDRVYNTRVFPIYYCIDFFLLLQSSQVKCSPPPPKIPSISLLFESWVRCHCSCRFQVIHLFIPACVTSSEFTREVVMKFLPAEFERKSKTDLHRFSLMWFLWLRSGIIKAFIFLLLQAYLPVIYFFCKIWSKAVKNCIQWRVIFY